MHQINITLHVTFGIAALLVGIVPIISRKGGETHKKYGRYFLYLYAVAVGTAIIGSIFFTVRPFLVVITMLSFYTAFSGRRVLTTKTNGPQFIDLVVAILALTIAIGFQIYMNASHMIWDKSVIYSTLGALYLVTCYDIARYILPNPKFKKLWLYEHVYKIMSAYSALLSAFSGTVLEMFQPYSQIAPSILCFSIIFYQWFLLGKGTKNSAENLNTSNLEQELKETTPDTQTNSRPG